MPGPERRADVVVIGGGIVGLSVAWRAAGAGLSVTVCDPTPGRGATWAAAGMLAPVTESKVSEPGLVEAGLASLASWPAFAADLEEDAGRVVGLRREGTLQVAFDEDDRRAIEDLADVHRSLGLESTWCSARECRTLEPQLSARVRGGLRVGGDWQVDPRSVVDALEIALARRGGHLHRARVSEVLLAGPGRGGTGGAVALDDGTQWQGAWIVLAAGVESGRLPGLPPGTAPPVRPVKGDILRLRTDPEHVPLTLTLRGSVRGRPVYLVPRRDGEVVVGATTEDTGFSAPVRAGAVHDLLHAAIDILPALEELELVELRAGLRPGTPDNAPVVGPTPVPGLAVATGHYRHGVLLAPITADAVLAVLTEGDPPVAAAAFDPGRFG